jgi:hypothetical protein
VSCLAGTVLLGMSKKEKKRNNRELVSMIYCTRGGLATDSFLTTRKKNVSQRKERQQDKTRHSTLKQSIL